MDRIETICDGAALSGVFGWAEPLAVRGFLQRSDLRVDGDGAVIQVGAGLSEQT
ncbi:MAG TPA: hypothetical protein VFX16_27435 [Pseudonocardiaceae bacterium]|nr:hypothetical protein [Pseudonocardiaceae bacterium]